MRNKGTLSIRRALPRMSWAPKNLYNLWRRTVGPEADALRFRVTGSTTLFQQRWKSKALMRAYHGDYIPEKIFKRWYLPETLPDVRPQRSTSSSDDKADLAEYAKRKERAKRFEEKIQQKGMAPVGSLMMAEVERRIDVVVFRSCFAHSIYEARRLVVHGDVLLNGKKHTNANTRLAPGDMITVNPSAIRFFKDLPTEQDDVIERYFEPKPKEGEEKPVVAAKPAESEAAPPAIEGEAEAPSTTAESSSSTSSAPVESEPSTEEAPSTPPAPVKLTPFKLPYYASPHLFIPAYIEPSFSTCSAIYVRHPTARPGYSEIPTPYDADGALVRYAWEWYVQRRPRVRGTRRLTQGPEDRVKTVKVQEEVGGPAFNVRVGKGGKRNLKEDIERFKRAMKVARGSKVAA
ncbi:hypothetical protein MD484_g1000, partial [Candolleomyces efflorescens]